MTFKSAALAVVAAALAACGTSHGGEDGGTTFVAFASTFQPFRTWTSFADPGPPDNGTYPASVLGPRLQYISALPPHGSTEFPVGTVIVEVRQDTGKIFSGVKRGGGYNATGAINWEWFELMEASGSGSTVSIVWRGIGPPPGDTYGTDPSATCSSCHAMCGGSNDYVCSPELQLGSI
jgi:hypothetical protein